MNYENYVKKVEAFLQNVNPLGDAPNEQRTPIDKLVTTYYDVKSSNNKAEFIRNVVSSFNDINIENTITTPAFKQLSDNDKFVLKDLVNDFINFYNANSNFALSKELLRETFTTSIYGASNMTSNGQLMEFAIDKSQVSPENFIRIISNLDISLIPGQKEVMEMNITPTLLGYASQLRQLSPDLYEKFKFLINISNSYFNLVAITNSLIRGARTFVPPSTNMMNGPIGFTDIGNIGTDFTNGNMTANDYQQLITQIVQTFINVGSPNGQPIFNQNTLFQILQVVASPNDIIDIKNLMSGTPFRPNNAKMLLAALSVFITTPLNNPIDNVYIKLADVAIATLMAMKNNVFTSSAIISAYNTYNCWQQVQEAEYSLVPTLETVLSADIMLGKNYFTTAFAMEIPNYAELASFANTFLTMQPNRMQLINKNAILDNAKLMNPSAMTITSNDVASFFMANNYNFNSEDIKGQVCVALANIFNKM